VGSNESNDSNTPQILRRLQNQTGNQLINQAAGSSVGIPSPGFVPQQSVVQQQAQQGGQGNFNRLTAQAFNGATQNAARQAFMPSLNRLTQLPFNKNPFNWM
jgi:hypothetical protein